MPQDCFQNLLPVMIGNSIYFSRMEKDATPPSYTKNGDAGMDIYSYEDVFLSKGERKIVHTKVKVHIPAGTVGLVCPRSGLASKSGITVMNAPGIIDPSYRGELMVCLYNSDKHGYQVSKGDRIAQLVIIPFVQCKTFEKDELEFNIERGESGFGASGK